MISTMTPLARPIAAFVLSAGLLSACTVYHPLPLPEAPNFKPIAVDHPLTMTEVAALAVARNPDLVASRRKAAVAEAQSFAAGLLPDPQLTASADLPTAPPGLATAYAFGLSEDLQALLTHPAKAAAAEAAADQAKLAALWDEWQTIEKACTLYVQRVLADRKRVLLLAAADRLSAQSQRASRALANRDVTLDQAGADLAAALDAESLANVASRDALTADSGLKALIDAPPDAVLNLGDLAPPLLYTRDELREALTRLDKVRPDLLALKAGYRSQEENVWVAVLSQFPTMSLGPTRATDTSNVHTTGLALTLNLPIFNGARGEIRIQSATRAQLHAEYQARLDQTAADAWRLWNEIELLEAQLAALEAKLPAFRRMAEVAQKAHANRDIAPATYLAMQTTLTARESELLDLRSALWLDAIALHTLLGTPYVMPPNRGGA